MTEEGLSPDLLVQALNWVYDRVAPPVPHAPISERALNRQIALLTAGAGAAGFVSNLGGLLTLPISLPANLAGVAAIQLRLITTVAAARGHDTESETVRTLGIACLTGTAALDILKEAGIRAGQRLAERAVAGISAAALAQVNRRVGFALLARTGAGGLVNLGKAVPLVGGLVGAGFDAASTGATAAVAKRVFPRLPDAGLRALPAPEVPVA